MSGYVTSQVRLVHVRSGKVSSGQLIFG